MDSIAIGFWGAFFGAASLMLVASLAAFARSLRRVALMAALSSAISALFVIAYLGWLPVGGADAQARLLAHVAVVSAVALGLMLLAMLGWLRRRDRAGPAVVMLGGAGALVLALGWAVEAVQALALSSAMALAVGAAMWLITLRSALRGDRLAGTAVLGVTFMLVALGGLSWIALDAEVVAWPVHAVSAVSGIAYLVTMARALWARYSYLLELSQVRALGPAYDPVTRMRSHSETGNLLGDVFFRREGEMRTVGIIVVSIANLYALENLHGRAAFNHALFLCGSRLRRVVPTDVDMGRLADDGFLLLVRNAEDMQRLVQLARVVRERLMHPVALSTVGEPGRLQEAETDWQPELGIGVLPVPPDARPAQAVATVRALSRTAWTYGSRMAWYDTVSGQITELPATDPA